MMSASLEDAIQKIVRKLPDEQQRKVLEFVKGLEPNAVLEQLSSSSSSADYKSQGIDLQEQGIDPGQAADLRASLATFEDWNDPEMDIYDDYDQNLASLNKRT